ncbi:MAG: DNA-binding protein [Betaproteobacteria bacterium]|nr:DNA-binding protein [Betaproteobacteria bacterium]
MTLQNLLKIDRLKQHAPTPQEIQRLLVAEQRNLADARNEAISDETRFDVAYKAIMQLALAAMMASGYRPSTNELGHHQTMIQSLPLTLDVPNESWVVLDALRRKRNVADYHGDPIEPEAVAECIAQAKALLTATRQWLEVQHPELLRTTP